MKINCLIIDDEPLARKRLNTLIKNIPQLNVIDECSKGAEAIEKIDNYRPELIFLDIQMKDMNGFEVLDNIVHKPLTIFVTAHDDYAIQAFDFFAFDYLLKPYMKERFMTSVQRAISYYNTQSLRQQDQRIEKLLNYIDKSDDDQQGLNLLKQKLKVKTEGHVLFVAINRIKYILASGNYVDIHTAEHIYVSRTSLTNIIASKTDSSLVRIHRSTIINVDYIDKILYSNYGEIDVKMTDNNMFRISKSFRKQFQKLLDL